MTRSKRAPLWRALATVLTGALVASAALVGIAVPAQAADGPSISSTLAPRAGGTIAVTGSGFSTEGFGIYLSLRAAGSTADLAGTTVWIDDTNDNGAMDGLGATAKMTADGSFSVQIPAPAYAEGVTYSIVTRKAHGGVDPTQSTTTPIAYEAAPAPVATPTVTTLAVSPSGTSAEGAAVTLTATVAPAAAGTVTFGGANASASVLDGIASIQLDAPAVGTHSYTATFTPADTTAFAGSVSATVAHVVTAAPVDPGTPVEFTPAISVFLADGVTPYTGQPVYTQDELVVKGTGFDPAANVGGYGRPIPSTLPQGTYVVFGSFLDAWKPSASAPSSARKVVTQKWALAESVLTQLSPDVQPIIRALWADVSADGRFTATLTAKDLAQGLADGNWGVYTYPAGGSSNPAQELSVPINYVGDAPVEFTPAISVFLADGVTPYTGQPVYTQDELVVKGTGFDPAANVGGRGVPIPATLPQGSYVVLGSFLDDWRPSAKAPSAARSVVSQAWALTASVVDQVPQAFQQTVRAQWTELAMDGSFTTTLTADEFSKGLADGNWGVYTYGAGGMVNPAQELSVPINYVGSPVVTPEIALSAASVQQGGSLTVTGSGFTAESLVTITVNSDPITLGTATVAADGTFTVAGTVPADFAAGTHTVVATVDGLPTASRSLTVTPAAVPAPPVEAPAEPSCVARSVSGATIQWSVKESFRSYIQGPIAKGSYSLNWGSGAGAYSTETDRGRVSYGGTASFTGHSGLLSVNISNPRIQVNSGGSATLIVNVRATNPDGSPSVNANGVAFANLSLPAANESGNRISWTGVSATLTAAGAKAFAGFYEAGAALDPLSFSFPLGAEVECDSTTTGSLAATGGETRFDELWLAMGLLVVGAGLFALRRRAVRS